MVWRTKRAWKEPLEEDPMPEADGTGGVGGGVECGERLPTGGRGSETETRNVVVEQEPVE